MGRGRGRGRSQFEDSDTRPPSRRKDGQIIRRTIFLLTAHWIFIDFDLINVNLVVAEPELSNDHIHSKLLFLPFKLH